MNNLAIYDQQSGVLDFLYENCKDDYNVKAFHSITQLAYDFKYLKTLDVLFAHIQCEKDFEEIKKIKEIKPELIILFYGNDMELILSAFEIPHLYFMMIDQMETVLAKAMHLLQEELIHTKRKESLNEIREIPIEDIVMMEKDEDLIRIVTDEFELNVVMPFDQAIESLEKDGFVNINDVCLVNEKKLNDSSHKNLRAVLKKSFG